MIPGSADYDLSLTEDIEIKPNSLKKKFGRYRFKTSDIMVGSALALVTRWSLQEVKVALSILIFKEIFPWYFFNFSNKFYKVNIGDRIVQLVLEKLLTPLLEKGYEFKEKN